MQEKGSIQKAAGVIFVSLILISMLILIGITKVNEDQIDRSNQDYLNKHCLVVGYQKQYVSGGGTVNNPTYACTPGIKVPQP